MTAALLERTEVKVTPIIEQYPVKRQPLTVCVISDTHMEEPELPDADLLIHCGDMTYEGRYEELQKVNDWFGRVESQFKHGIIYIAGNHDFMFERNPTLASAIMTHGTYLQDDSIWVGDWRIHGSPWTPQFGDWAFMDQDEQLSVHWDKAPNPLDVLVTHGPMYMVRDLTDRGVNAGSKSLCKLNPRYHFFGHIHEGYGVETRYDTTYVNAAIMDEDYNPVNKPVLVTLEGY